MKYADVAENVHLLLDDIRHERERIEMDKHLAEKENKTIWVTMNTRLAKELEQRAASMGLTPATYCKIILLNRIESGRI